MTGGLAADAPVDDARRAVGEAMVRAWGARGTVAEAFHADRPAGGYEIG